MKELTIMSNWHGGKGSKRRVEDASAINSRWPDFKKLMRWDINGEVVELTYADMLRYKRKNVSAIIKEL